MPMQMTYGRVPTWPAPAMPTAPDQAGGRLVVACLAGLTYVLAATGGIGVVNTGGLRSTFGIAALVSLLLIGMHRQTHLRKSEIFALGFIFAAFLLQGLRSTLPDLALEKLNGLIFGTSTLFLAARIGIGYGTTRFLRWFIAAAVAVLLLTIAYKFHYGFADRSVRYFINGPIVFGWMMGISALVTIFLASALRQRWYYALTVIFLVAIIWSGSKGPLLAIMPAIGLLIYHAGGGARAFILLSIFSAGLYTAYMEELLPERFYVIDRLLLSQLNENDFGSIGARVEMWRYSWVVFLDNPLLGTGLGNWPVQINTHQDAVGYFVYPHNMVLELLTEHGLFITAAVLALLVIFYRRSSALGQAIFLMVLIGLQFTGDASYWHLLLGLPMALTDRTV